MSPELSSLAVAGIAAVATYGLTWAVRPLATRRGLVVPPDNERIHTRPLPTAGGVAIAVGFAVAVLIAGKYAAFGADFRVNAEAVKGVLLAVAVMALLGLIDDVRSVSPPAKVAGQVLAAMVLYFFGVTMTQFKVPFLPGYIVLGSSVLPLVTALWVIGIANAVNLIDGLDGLAAGVIAIGSGSLCIYGLRLIDLGYLGPHNIGPLLAAACCGACIGFLPHNFHRARIIMGDTGAMVLGLVMAAATMEIGGQAYQVFSGATYFFFAPLIVPLIILGVPILDTALSIMRRTIRRTHVTERDLGHLHYRLLRLGHGHRRAVLLMWAWTLALSAMVLGPTLEPKLNKALPYALGVLAVALVIIFRPWSSGQVTDLKSAADTNATSLGAGPSSPASSRPMVAAHVGSDTAGPASAEREETMRRAHRRRFARHHPPMRG